MSQDVSVFDDCNSTNVNLYLNSEFYSYNDLNVDFDKIDTLSCLICMHVFVKFITDCYKTLLTVITFLTNGPFVIIGCLTKRVHQERCRWTNRIWLHRECTHEYYLLSHLTRSCDWILPVFQCSTQDHCKLHIVNCKYLGKDKNQNALQWGIFSKNCSSWSYQRL